MYSFSAAFEGWPRLMTPPAVRHKGQAHLPTPHLREPQLSTTTYARSRCSIPANSRYSQCRLQPRVFQRYAHRLAHAQPYLYVQLCRSAPNWTQNGTCSATIRNGRSFPPIRISATGRSSAISPTSSSARSPRHRYRQQSESGVANPVRLLTPARPFGARRVERLNSAAPHRSRAQRPVASRLNEQGIVTPAHRPG